MLPIAIILKEKSSSSSRTIAYETLKKENIVIVQQEHQGKDWKTVKHMALPVVTFDFIQSFRFEKASFKGAQYTLEFVAGCTREFIFDSNVLGDDIRRILYDYDVQEVPIYENQEEYWQYLELIEHFWKTPAITETPDSTTKNLENSITSTTISTSLIKTTECSRLVATKSLETPPVSSCLAPKKRKL